MRTTVSSKGQIVLPAEFREQDRIEPGHQFEVERVEAGQYLLKKVPAQGGDILSWLLACPVKGWFKPLPPSESTESLGVGLFGESDS
jgi:AbrB family looped-hinge helix DNA binding protein